MASQLARVREQIAQATAAARTDLANQIMWNRLLSVVEEQAQALIRTSYLMDDAVQAFYRTLARASFPAGAVVRVRRPDAALGEDAPFVAPGTATLQAMKRVWAQDWTFDAVLERLDSAGSVALEARSTLLYPA